MIRPFLFEKMSLYPRLVAFYFEILRWERLPVSKIRELQLRKFAALVEHAKRHSPFYRSLYEQAGVLGLEIRTEEDIRRLPIVDKEMLKNADVLTADLNSPGINSFTTSGSTGQPFKIYINKFEDYTAHVRVFRGLQREGYGPRKRITMITRYEKDDTFKIERDMSILLKLQRRFGIFNREIISIYEPVDQIIDKVMHSPPDVLWSTPSIMQIIAYRLRDRGLAFNLPVVFLTSETIFPKQWNLFKQVIAHRVVDLYGAAECTTMALGHDDQHCKQVFSNSVHVDYINETRDGDTTRVSPIVTNLVNFTMPFIRYDLHDYVEKLNTEEFPIRELGKVLGRVDDLLTLPSGAVLAHHHAHDMFMDFDSIEHWKIVQSQDKIELLLKLRPDSTDQKEQIMDAAQERWRKRYKDDKLTITTVDKFEVDPLTGKVRNLERRL